MGAGSNPALGTFFLHTEMVTNRVFSIGEAKFSPAALKDTITGLVEPILVDFGWSEEKTKEMRRAGIEPPPCLTVMTGPGGGGPFDTFIPVVGHPQK